MIHSESYRERHYRPQAAKTLRQSLICFLSQEFPRLGGPWVIEMFVDKLLSLIDACYLPSERLLPGQTLWPAVATDERPGEHKPMTQTRLVPVVVSLVNQEDIADLCTQQPRRTILQQALVRAALDAQAQGGVFSCTDLALLFHRHEGYVAQLLSEHERLTGQIVPRRGNVHDMGPTLSHKAIICRKAYLEGKPTHVVARETCHSPDAVDRYVLDFQRVYFAVIQRQMTRAQAAFALRLPPGLVQQYLELMEEFGLTEQQVVARAGKLLPTRDPSSASEPMPTSETQKDENRQP